MKINIDFIYPVGAIYMSINSTNPSTLFGGTWKQMTDDAYLKIVTSNAGETGGTSSDHKIPIESMPTHDHKLMGYRATTADATASDKRPRMYARGSGSGWDGDGSILNTGGGQAYYPYYVGVYMWIRTA